MKIIKIILLIIFLGTVFACSNDFLQVKQQVDSLALDTLFMDDLASQKNINFELLNGGNSHWRILQYPSSLDVSPMEGNFQQGKSSIILSLKPGVDLGDLGLFSLPLIFDVKGIGLVQFPFLFMHYGHAQLLWDGNFCGFDYGSQKSFTFRNGSDILAWEIKSKPAWLTVSKEKGTLAADRSETLTLNVDRGTLPNGTYRGIVNFVSNSPEKEFNLQVEMKVLDTFFAGVVIPINGTVVDADYNKPSGVLALALTNPSRLRIFKPGQPTSEMTLNKIPTSVALSENGEQAVCSFTNTDLSVIDIGSLTITKNITVGSIASDIALGNNGWAYLAPKDFMDYYLKSVNLITGEVVKNNTDVREMSQLKKVPGKNLIFGTKGGAWSNYLMVTDISNGAASTVIDQWDVFLWNFWLSEDGNRIFCGYKPIYQAPEYQNQVFISKQPTVLGQLENLGFSVTSVVHSSLLKEIFAVYSSSETAAKIYRFDDATYLRKGVLQVNESEIITSFGNLVILRTELPYMYVDKTGSELILIKKGLSQSTDEAYWFLEKIKLK